MRWHPRDEILIRKTPKHTRRKKPLVKLLRHVILSRPPYLLLSTDISAF